MRQCKRCGWWKAAKAFRTYRQWKTSGRYVLLQTWCYDCEKAYGRAYYHRRKEASHGEGQEGVTS